MQPPSQRLGRQPEGAHSGGQTVFIIAYEIARATLTVSRQYQVRRLARRLRVEVDDAVGIVFAKALKRFSTWREDKGALERWIGGIFRRALYDLRRAASRRLAHSLSERNYGGAIPDHRKSSALDLLIAREEETRFAAGLQREDALTREIVRLHFVEGHTFQQTARQLSLPMSRVTQRWYAWRRRMRGQLEDARSRRM
jgi:RNA polymerase sigma factor (sigma-70 family)